MSGFYKWVCQAGSKFTGKTVSMTTPFSGLRTVIYKVPDIDKAKEWYAGVLGIQPYFDKPFYVGFNVAGYELGLQPAEGKVESGDNVTVYFGVKDVAMIYQQLITAGATPHEKPTDVGGDIVVAAVKDPWGNLFGIIYNPHFKI